MEAEPNPQVFEPLIFICPDGRFGIVIPQPEPERELLIVCQNRGDVDAIKAEWVLGPKPEAKF